MTKVSLNVFRISATDDGNLHKIVIAYFRALFARKKHGSLSFERFYFQPSLLPLGDDFQYFPISCSLSPPIVFPYLICRSWTICVYHSEVNSLLFFGQSETTTRNTSAAQA